MRMASLPVGIQGCTQMYRYGLILDSSRRPLSHLLQHLKTKHSFSSADTLLPNCQKILSNMQSIGTSGSCAKLRNFNNFFSNQRFLSSKHSPNTWISSCQLLSEQDFTKCDRHKQLTGLPANLLISRGFHPKSEPERPNHEDMGDIVSQLQEQQDASQEQNAMLIKLANENGYLSWCRNAYISALAGYTIYGHLLVPYGHDAGLTFFLIGLVNMLIGSTIFIKNEIKLRRLQMRRGIGLVSIILALMHIMLYIFVITAIDRVAEELQDGDLDEVVEEILSKRDDDDD